MKLYYIANARMPTEKAHGIQIAKMCEAFVEEGIDVTLVVPKRQKNNQPIKEYYKLRTDIPVVYLPAINWYTGGRIGFLISSVSFILSYVIFILKKKSSGEKFILYTVDMDTYSSSPLALFSEPLFSEMHTAKRASLPQRFLFKKIRGIIAINKIIVEEFRKNFPSSRAKYAVEPNGVDQEAFTPKMSKRESREKLGLPLDVSVVLYNGRFFDWKGLEIIAQTASKTPGLRWQMVGGTKDSFAQFVHEQIPENIFFAGSRPHEDMATWLTAADALLVLGTKRDIQSYRYTSPMKLFEYLVAERPIVASSTPAIREIVSEKEVLFYEPDDASSLAQTAERAVRGGQELAPMIHAAKELGATFSWRARARRIKKFMS